MGRHAPIGGEGGLLVPGHPRREEGARLLVLGGGAEGGGWEVGGQANVM